MVIQDVKSMAHVKIAAKGRHAKAYSVSPHLIHNRLCHLPATLDDVETTQKGTGAVLL